MVQLGGLGEICLFFPDAEKNLKAITENIQLKRKAAAIITFYCNNQSNYKPREN